MSGGLLDLVDIVRRLIKPHREGVAQIVDGVERLDLARRVELWTGSRAAYGWVPALFNFIDRFPKLSG
jgi:hypothetical protein